MAAELDSMDLQSQFRGCITGLAVGDALGMPAEGMSVEQINEIYGRIDCYLPSPVGDFNAGEWTDDTEQAIILAQSIAETIYFSPEDFSERLKKWGIESMNPRIGPTTRRAIYRLSQGAEWKNSGIISDTCGAAMRVAPVGLVYHFNLDLVERYAVISAMVTHKGDAAIAGSVAVAVAVASILLDFDDAEIAEEAATRATKYDELLADKVRYAYKIAGEDVGKAIAELGNSISSYDAVPFAFYCYFSAEKFSDAVITAVNSGGDADSTAAIAGSLMGAKVGLEGIEKKFLESLKDLDYLIGVADRLYKTHQKIISITSS